MQKSTVILLVMALASAGVSAGLWIQLRAERELNAELSERLIAAAPTPIAPEQVASLPADPPAVIAPIVATATSTPPPGPVEPTAARSERVSPEHWQTRQRQLMNDPRYREAFREQQRLRLATRRENFIRLLGFSPEQADAVIDLSVEREMESQARSNAMTADEIQQRRESMESQERAYQAQLRDLLGADKSAQLQSYMESRQTRMQVDRFRTQLTGNDLLRDDQVEPLITALHGEQAQMQKEMQEYRETLSPEKYAERQAEMMKAAHRRMHSAASGVLSNSQLERLDTMLKRELERYEAQQQMTRIRSKLDQSNVAVTVPSTPPN